MHSPERHRSAGAPRPPDRARSAADYHFIVLPYAGGSADSFRSIRRHLAGWGPVTLIDYASLAEPAAGIAALAERLSGQVLASPLPTILFGHSLGGFIAFEMAARLAATGQVRHLILSACAAPTSAPFRALQTCADDAQALDYLRRRDGLPPGSVRKDGQQRRLRHDLAQLHGYQPSHQPLACPITCLAGDDDQIAPASAMAPWHALSRVSAQTHIFPGGHFFCVGRSHEIAALMRDASAKDAAPPSACRTPA